MKIRLDRRATAMAAAILLAYGTAADAADSKPGDAAPRAERAASPTAQQAPASAAAVRDLRMSELIGMDVRNAKGENLGDIKDLVVDADSGRIQYAVVGIGGVLGIGEKLSAFPMSAFKVSQGTPGGTRPMLDNDGVKGDKGPIGTDRTSAGAPANRTGAIDNDGVKGDKGPIGSDRTAAEAAKQGSAGPIDNDGVKGDKGPIGSDRSASPTDRSAATTAPATGTRPDGSTTTTAGRMLPGGAGGMHMVLAADPERLKQAPNFDSKAWPDWNDAKYRGEVDRAAGVTSQGKAGRMLRASQLMDADIRDAQNRDVGEIEDLVVDVRNGQVSYAVVDFDKAWTPDDKLVAVPMKALRASGDKGELVFSGDRSRLEGAPAFDKGKWPDLNAATYRSNVDRYLSGWGGASTAPGTGMSSAPTDRSRGTTAGTGGAAAGGTTGAPAGTTTR
jgi:sporulation protein YlmC with PRC-barrel domain